MALNWRGARTGRYVLYWMQASQRADSNHALEYAILQANEMGKPVVVYFGLTDRFPEANERHYYFMLEGLREVASSLENRGIRLIVRHESPQLGVVELSRDACLVVVDCGYLRVQKQWRGHAAERVDCPLIQVESDVIVPVEVASWKEEYSAATFRHKVGKGLAEYLVPVEESVPRADSLGLSLDSFDISSVDDAISRLDIDRSVKRTEAFHGGTSQARMRLEAFLDGKLDRYDELRNDPAQDYASNLSPYLHFGQISPLYVALRVEETGSPGRDAFLEELVVRRELSMNYAHYNRDYDSFRGLPEWARKTLGEHGNDSREYVYTLEDLEASRTHDVYWNAAQEEMKIRGKMHGYMRMYWAKKIIEWSASPEDAFSAALYLNNKYELDGRDPNGFTGVAWCFGKHDRPWAERHIFGKVRYMSQGGLRKKFDADEYVRRVARLGSAREGQ